MNTHFKDLAIKAGLYVDVNGKPWPKNMNGEDIEGAYDKFAALLLKECLDVCVSFGESGDGYTLASELCERFEFDDMDYSDIY